MKNTQQFCESIYHKYELALETRREKQRVRFMIVQRSAAAAAVVTVAVGSSSIRRTENCLSRPALPSPRRRIRLGAS